MFILYKADNFDNASMHYLFSSIMFSFEISFLFVYCTLHSHHSLAYTSPFLNGVLHLFRIALPKVKELWETDFKKDGQNQSRMVTYPDFHHKYPAYFTSHNAIRYCLSIDVPWQTNAQFFSTLPGLKKQIEPGPNLTHYYQFSSAT